jgi:ABC-type methionine transport system ATPase subunit
MTIFRPPANAKAILVVGTAGAGKTSLIRLATRLNIPVGNGTQAGMLIIDPLFFKA